MGTHQSYSKEQTKLKSTEIESHGKKYYVNEADENLITQKAMVIIPIFISAIIFPLFMKLKYGVNLLNKDENKA